MNLFANEPHTALRPNHLHFESETCPVCEQIIPNDRLESVRARRDAQEQALEAKFARLAEDEQIRQAKLLQAEKAEAIAKLQSEITAREAAARDAGRKAATAEAEEVLCAANKAAQTANARVDELTKELAATANEVTAKIINARHEARTQVKAELQPLLLAAEAAAKTAVDEKQAALAARMTAEQQVELLKESQEKAVAQRTQDARDALEKRHLEVLNAEKSKHFEETQKIQSQLADVQRKLENKTAQDLGEGAEVDLYEALKAAFGEDDITRIAKGLAGADIRHKVRHSGKDCGVILYDSKNHKAWRGEFVTKLRDDQIAGKADFAILSTIAFPQGSKQLHVQDNVILVNPARAVTIAQIVREQVVRAHALRLSDVDREKKTQALYAFITSERFAIQLSKVQTSLDTLSELDLKEQTAHKLTWQKRSQLHSGIAKAEADLRAEIDYIVGTSEQVDAALDFSLRISNAATVS